MPLGESLGEFEFKAKSVRHIALDGGQIRIEVDFEGEAGGDVPGYHFGTLAYCPLMPNLPFAWTYTGTTLGTSGSVVAITAQGAGARTGDGHKIRFRGASTYHTDDPKMAEFNHVIAAVEAEADPLTMTLKGLACIWK